LASRLERDGFGRIAISRDIFLRMISAQALRVCREGKPVPTLRIMLSLQAVLSARPVKCCGAKREPNRASGIHVRGADFHFTFTSPI
jgi:hypothetical protein